MATFEGVHSSVNLTTIPSSKWLIKNYGIATSDKSICSHSWVWIQSVDLMGGLNCVALNCWKRSAPIKMTMAVGGAIKYWQLHFSLLFVFDNELWCRQKVIRIMMMSRMPIYLPLMLLHVLLLDCYGEHGKPSTGASAPGVKTDPWHSLGHKTLLRCNVIILWYLI